jgi:hypothetical protein
MSQTKVLLVTGLLRGFEDALGYLETTDAFSNYQVILSTWESQVQDNSENLKIFERNGGHLVLTPAIHLGRHTSVVSQHLSLARGLIPEISNSTIVIKTRTDWMVEHNILNDTERVRLNKRAPEILTAGFIPSSPYFLPDGHFVSTAKNLRRIANLDLVDILRYSYIHPEQNFFLPNFGQRSVALEKWLGIDIGTQFERLATSQWVKIRLKSKLFFYVIGEYFSWIHKNIGPIRFEEMKIKQFKIEEFLFGGRNEGSSRDTKLILRNHINVDNLKKLSFPDKSLQDYFWSGFYGANLEENELENICIELEQGIKRNFVLRNVRDTVKGSNFMISTEVADQLASLQNEVSWLREKVRALQGTDII